MPLLNRQGRRGTQGKRGGPQGVATAVGWTPSTICLVDVRSTAFRREDRSDPRKRGTPNSHHEEHEAHTKGGIDSMIQQHGFLHFALFVSFVVNRRRKVLNHSAACLSRRELSDPQARLGRLAKGQADSLPRQRQRCRMGENRITKPLMGSQKPFVISLCEPNVSGTNAGDFAAFNLPSSAWVRRSGRSRQSFWSCWIRGDRSHRPGSCPPNCCPELPS